MNPSDFPFQTVDPKYVHFLMLVGFLVKLNVISVIGHRKHSFSIASQMLGGSAPQPKPHWIPMAIVSLSADFMELEFGPGKKVK